MPYTNQKMCNSLFNTALKLIFLKKEELILEQKYGEAYLNYKKKVSTWI